MKFKLKQNTTNLFPKGAFLIEEASPYFWLKELQKMGFDLSEITAFPVPSLVPNQLYGCLIVYRKLPKGLNICKHRYFQNCHNRLFIPENTMVSPAFTDEEWALVFSENPHIYHPFFGLVELSEAVNWLAILNLAIETFPSIQVARTGVAIHQSITSLQIAVDQEALLKQLENPISEEEALEKLPFDMKKVLRGNQKEIDKYLKFLDEHPEMALKYAIPLDVLNTNRGNLNGKYRFGSSFKDRFRDFFSSRKSSPAYGSSGTGGGGGFSGSSESESWFGSAGFKFLLRIVFFLFLFGRAVSMSSGAMFGVLKAIFFIGIFLGILYLIYKFFKNREDRPFNAGSSRPISYPNSSTRSVTPENDLYKYLPFIVVFLIVGLSIAFVKFISSDHVDFSISPIFYLLGFFAIVFAVIFLVVKLLDKIQSSRHHAERGGSTGLLDNNRFSTLQQRYEKLAQDFIDKKEYEKAAHVYRKLLQNNFAAASTLEQGALYQEAAVTYLKLCQNKEKASECFEKGKSYKEAIELHKELGQKEKVGDLYLLLHQKNEADKYFHQVVEDYKANNQFVKASLILRNKVKDTTTAQNMLLEGWRTNRDASNCLNNYFVNISNVDDLETEIQTIYNTEIDAENSEAFLQLLKIEFKKDAQLEPVTREIAYEIIASKIEKKFDISTVLLDFNKGNTSLSKDVMRYKLNSRKSV